MKKAILLLLTCLVFSCSQKNTPIDSTALKAEVAKAEDDFKNLAQAKGIQEAFYTFADSNAIIKRDNDSLIKGKEAIKTFFSNPKFKKAAVTWKPDFIDVSNDGTLAYTYGKYVWTVTDSLGNKKDFKGVFHTVWKKQKDGHWKFVWD
ncbi:YybH family protein [Flavobacterium sp.]|uniref:YybH family protein n=1 Tax=Flavobacterium sp. TaxID=239 RepID=UPI002FDADAC2